MTASKKSIKRIIKKESTNGIKNSQSMKTAEIRDLIDYISKSGLNEVNIETSELKLHIKKEPDQKVYKTMGTPMVQAAQPVAAALPQAPVVKTEAAPAPKGSTLLEIKSPMIGTFYRSANPDSPPFASVGDKITKGQTIGVIEAMKLFNEIESEYSGTVVKVLVENSSPVEYDQVLFQVEPD